MATVTIYGEEYDTGIAIDVLALDTLLAHHPLRPPLSTVQVQENLDRLAYKLLGEDEDDGDTDTEPGPEEGTGDDGDDDGGH